MTTGRTASVAPAVLVATGVGALVAAQSRLNGDLAVAGAGTLVAGWLSYVGTVTAIAVLVALRGRAARTARVLRHSGRWWWFAIGLCGVPIVLASAFGVPLVGVAVASVASVAGQTVAGLALDARGVGVPGRLPLDLRRALAALTAIGGLLLAMSSGSGDVGVGTGGAVTVGVLLFLSGAALAGQNAGNGAVTRDSGDPAIAGLASAVGGTLALTVALAAATPAGALDGVVVPGPERWYLYLGGPLGAGIVVAAAWVVRRLGTFSLTLAVVSGQLVTAMLVDANRGLGAPWTTVASVGAVVVATALGVARRPRRRGTSRTVEAQDEAAAAPGE
ncbi:DMT family transporter [Isoptericola sp. b490]|uniref:DMT family transporter n=1 Tax=Actinotalea lenta TaxID=3064654 RepID=UPI0027141487|nr:DMT family transporter [Isoptericola sp. b490]MDO8121254.1 DMT family transporter [Isoptericola sp. b490]